MALGTTAGTDTSIVLLADGGVDATTENEQNKQPPLPPGALRQWSESTGRCEVLTKDAVSDRLVDTPALLERRDRTLEKSGLYKMQRSAANKRSGFLEQLSKGLLNDAADSNRRHHAWHNLDFGEVPGTESRDVLHTFGRTEI
jgi:hypothetical protein